MGILVKNVRYNGNPNDFFLKEQRAPRERAPSSELRLEGKGVKRTRETVVPFCEVEKEISEGRDRKNCQGVLWRKRKSHPSSVVPI